MAIRSNEQVMTDAGFVAGYIGVKEGSDDAEYFMVDTDLTAHPFADYKEWYAAWIKRGTILADGTTLE